LPEQPVRCSAMQLTVPDSAPCGPLVACYPHALRAARRCNPLVQSTPLRRLPQADAQPAVAVPIGFGRCAVTGRFAAAPDPSFCLCPCLAPFKDLHFVYETDRAKTAFQEHQKEQHETTTHRPAVAAAKTFQPIPPSLLTHPTISALTPQPQPLHLLTHHGPPSRQLQRRRARGPLAARPRRGRSYGQGRGIRQSGLRQRGRGRTSRVAATPRPVLLGALRRVVRAQHRL
jgi:hypothetical protein